MKLTMSIARLIGRLEYIIGSQCYNSNSYNGWTGEYGCSFRYPVWYKEEKHHSSVYLKIKYPEDKAHDIQTLYYKFGSNKLHVGNGLLEILEYLEKRYDLDFVELEKKAQKKGRILQVWCSRRDLNSYAEAHGPKPCAYANSATRT